MAVGLSRVGGGLPATPADVADRDWVFPGADDVFRGIYMRSCNSNREMLAVCSAIAGEGKTTVAIGLGVAMAQDFPDRRVLLVETDLRQPVLAKDFDLEPAPGLAECLQDNLPMRTAYRRRIWKIWTWCRVALQHSIRRVCCDPRAWQPRSMRCAKAMTW